MHTFIWSIAVTAGIFWCTGAFAGCKRSAGKMSRLTVSPKRFRYQKLSPDELAQKLIAAVYAEDLDSVHAYLAAGADATRFVLEQGIPLHIAVLQGLAGIVATMLGEGAAINTVDQFGDTALHIAVSKGYGSVVRTLLQKHPNTNTFNHDGKTALHIASYKGYVAITQALLNAGARADLLCGRGYTPLFYASSKGHHRVVGALLSKNADTSVSCHQGMTALHGAVDAACIQTMKILLRAGAAPNAIDTEAQTPLHIAVLKGNLLAVNLLIKAGAPLDAIDARGCTALHHALRAWLLKCRNFIAFVTVLLEAGANPNIAAVSCGTPLQQIAAEGDSEVMRLLINHGAELISEKNGHKTALERFYTSLLSKKKRAHCHYMQELISWYAKAVGSDGDSILHRLLLEEHPNDSLIRLLIGCKTCVEDGMYRTLLINHKNQDGQTPLHRAAERGNRYATLLLRNGADRKATMPNGETMDSILRGKKSLMPLVHDSEVTGLMKIANKATDTHDDSLLALRVALEQEVNPAYITRYYNSALSCCYSEAGQEMIRKAILKKRRIELLNYLEHRHNQPKVLADLQLQFAGTYEKS